MSSANRRTAQRYVLGDLLLEVNGVVHETVDISARSVAVIAQPGIDYAMRRSHARFISAKLAKLNREVRWLAVTGLRESLAIFDYAVDDPDWEALLRQHDAANDVVILEDIFG